MQDFFRQSPMFSKNVKIPEHLTFKVKKDPQSELSGIAKETEVEKEKVE